MHDYYQCFTTYSFHRSRSTTTKCNRGIQQTTMWKQGFYPWELKAVSLWVSLFEAIHALPLNIEPRIATKRNKCFFNIFELFEKLYL